MNLSSYRRRVRRLERAVKADDSASLLDKYVPRGFGVWVDRLPNGTEIPKGARVVKDFYPFSPVDWNDSRRGFVPGVFYERITADPNDYGVHYDTPHPDFIKLDEEVDGLTPEAPAETTPEKS